MSSQKKRDQLILHTALTAGRIMIENGSEVERVEDTMERIAHNAGAKTSQLFVMITGILMAINGEVGAQIEPVKRRTFDLEKISVVNDLSRQFADHKITLQQFASRLDQLDKSKKYFPFWLQLLAAAMVSGPLEVVFRHNLPDFWITCVVGALGWLVFYLLNKFIQIRFLSEFAAAATIGVLAIWSVHLGLGNSVDDIIIGSVMPLVPGVPITNSVRDILAGNLVSGPARGVEALVSAAAIGFGIAMVLQFL
ncbi:threonine/serine exporter family protein [Levilactobacillus tujiorum]|uniref:Threonine/serine exporter family protein n=1 Tax=Levilactobacillus tujiorum TaxID=2912243 RepID=A0ABX1L3G2_9LACO|nr:threonine/serine exporter family protein [Levilactobacillus tujiorum]MCH5463771.1 threonine/serine exporter family protein [Levilactobacillus tujiorum]NLR10978.1 threonine/serine exporter family protein [Lactobacillus sp. HBUAS51387]NLR28824.1 threonine/serine exporter family protein [Levilactobacillus tujiorum]NLR31662.1 threonine/serine exporter family protein [Levilactobacillus tujiorum]